MEETKLVLIIPKIRDNFKLEDRDYTPFDLCNKKKITQEEFLERTKHEADGYIILRLSDLSVGVFQDFERKEYLGKDVTCDMGWKINLLCGENSEGREFLHDISKSDEIQPIGKIEKFIGGNKQLLKAIWEGVEYTSKFSYKRYVNQVAPRVNIIGAEYVLIMEYNQETKRLLSILRNVKMMKNPKENVTHELPI